MKKEHPLIINSMAQTLKIPRDLAFQECFINLQENQKILLQNFCNIIEYTNQEILVQTKHNKIRIYGKRLEIEYFTKDEMQISGQIQKICYE